MKISYKIGMIGFGSIGRRHLHNIISVLKERKTTYTIDVIRSGIGTHIEEKVEKLINNIFYSYDEVPSDYDIIFITNPTHLHFETIKMYVSKTNHMFIEKPVFDRIDVDITKLNLLAGGIYYVACPLRHTNVIQYLKNKCNLNDVYCVRVICSSYLPDWRSNIDYRTIYSSYKDQGGGVSIDLIHEWDYIRYLFGSPDRVVNIRGKYSNLEIDSDDLSLYIAKYKNMLAEVHLDYFGRKSIREIQLFTNKDTIIGDISNSEIRYLCSGKIISFKEKRNEFQKKEIACFFDIIEGKETNHNDIPTAFKTLEIAMEGK